MRLGRHWLWRLGCLTVLAVLVGFDQGAAVRAVWQQGAATPGVGSTPAKHAIQLPLVLRRQVPGRSVANPAGMQISEVRFRKPEMIEEVRLAGGKWWRTFLFWDEVERVRTSPPTYDWHLYDPLFATADKAGLTVIAEVVGNPGWSAEYPGGPPRDLDTLAQFMAAVVERYDGDGVQDAPGGAEVLYWELYNEPDNTDRNLAREGRGWGYWGNQGAEYARMLKRVYPAIKVANRDAQVVFGGIAYDAFQPDGPFNKRFLDDVLGAGAGPSFDIMNFHFYPTFAPNWASFGPGLIGKVEAVRKKLQAYGLVKPILVTEAGVWSAGLPPYAPTNPEEQARYVPELYAQTVTAGVLASVWFQFDDVAGFDDPARGLVDRYLRPKPSLAAFRVAAEQFQGAVADPSLRDPSLEAEQYWFRRGPEHFAVVWVPGGPSATYALRATAAERVHYLGTRLTVRDDADGLADGVTHVPIGQDPAYIRPIP